MMGLRDRYRAGGRYKGQPITQETHDSIDRAVGMAAISEAWARSEADIARFRERLASAERKLRKASTPAKIGKAQQAVFKAQADLAKAQRIGKARIRKAQKKARGK